MVVVGGCGRLVVEFGWGVWGGWWLVVVDRVGMMRVMSGW